MDGKQFERKIKTLIEEKRYVGIRIPDSSYFQKYMPEGSFAPQSICDYIFYTPRKLLLIECKETDKDYITIGEQGQIKAHQVAQSKAICDKEETIEGYIVIRFNDGKDIKWLNIDNAACYEEIRKGLRQKSMRIHMEQLN